MECRKEKNLAGCDCTSLNFQRRGICCECVSYHWSHNSHPACLG